MIEPVEMSVDVECSVAHAFATWTERFGTWWPQSHLTSGDPDAIAILEPREGGRIFERSRDGNEIEWGWITVWNPPAHLGYRWHIRRSAAEATDVLVSFTALDAGRCRVDIRHTGWEALGELAPTWRDANIGGWSGLLPHFVAAASTPDAD